MKHLFTPFRIKDTILQNRIVLPPLASFLVENGGHITDQTIEHYRRRAAGGPAMVIMEACAVAPDGIVADNQARIDHDGCLEGLMKIAAALKSEGAVPALQIHHAGRQTSAKVIHRRPLAPSPLPCPTIRGDVEPLSVHQIQELVNRFAEAAVRGRQAGFELIEIHGAHGYLINQFLSRHSNVREDAYGGDTSGRSRFAREIVEEVRMRLGPEVPISFKISAQEFVPNGLTVKESIEILSILTDAGVDVVQVSAGNDSTPEWICQPMFMRKACLADSAAAIRKSINVPVMAVGRINDPWTADGIIAKGMADLVCIGRGLMADPELPIKARNGWFDDIRTCIACNTCMQSIFRYGRLECLVNPSLGREREMQLFPAKIRKKVMVIGGGLGGLITAWTAAKRGHEVHLFEKRPFFGGQLVPGSRAEYKREMQSLITYQEKQVERSGVVCHLQKTATAATVLEVDPDVVVLATGSRPTLPSVDGIDDESVVTFEAVFDGTPTDIGRIVIIGGGATGCEVAYHLSENGSSVTLVEMSPRIGGDLEAITKKVLIRKLKENNVRIITGHRLLRVESGSVVIAGTDGIDQRIRTDRVVVATGTQPDNAIHQKILDLGYETHVIGDCLKPRTAKSAIYEGTMLGRTI